MVQSLLKKSLFDIFIDYINDIYNILYKLFAYIYLFRIFQIKKIIFIIYNIEINNNLIV